MRDDKYLEWECEQYRQRIERRRTRREIRRRKQLRNKLFLLLAALLVLIASVMTIGTEGKDVERMVIVNEVVEMPEITAEEPVLESIGRFKITHYCPCEKCCGEWADGYTATMTKATDGRTIAVDPDVIPLGSEVAVFYDDGRISYYTAEDVGGAIKGNRIDVYKNTHEAALECGVIGASVYLVNEVE